MSDFGVVVGSGSLRGPGPTTPHTWTDDGVSVEADFTGAHLLRVDAVAEIPRVIRAGGGVRRR